MLYQILRFKLILCIFLYGTTRTYSQSNFGVGINASPAFLSVKPETNIHTYNYSNFGFIGGLNLIYNVNPKSSFTLGVQNFNVKYTVSYNFIYQQSGDPAIPVSSSFKTFYLGIPATYNYTIYSKSKNILSASIGFCPYFLMSSEDNTTFADSSIRKSGFLNSNFSSVQIGIGYCYRIKENISLKLEPTYRLFLKGIDSLMDQNPIILLFSVSCIINLNSVTGE